MRRAPYLGIGAAALLFALTACGGSDGSDGGGDSKAEAGFTDKSVAEILEAAEADMSSLETLRIVGQMETDGQAIALDLALATEGGCTGTVGIGDVQAQILVADERAYLKGGEDFWATATDADQAAAIVEIVGDKWVDAGAGDSFVELCNVDKFVSGMFEDSDGATVKGDVKKINGLEAIGITGDDADGETVGWVATSSPHYVLRMENGGEGAGGAIDFSDFNKEVKIDTPAADDVFDLSTFTG